MLWSYCSSLPSPVLLRPGTGLHGSGRGARVPGCGADQRSICPRYIAALWLRKLGSGLKALGALVSVRQRQPLAKTTVTGLTDPKEEVS